MDTRRSLWIFLKVLGSFLVIIALILLFFLGINNIIIAFSNPELTKTQLFLIQLKKYWIGYFLYIKDE